MLQHKQCFIVIHFSEMEPISKCFVEEGTRKVNRANTRKKHEDLINFTENIL